jgi:proline iminopeptidase
VEAAKRGVHPLKVATEINRARAPGYFFDHATALKFISELKEGMINPVVGQLTFAAIERDFDLRPNLQKLDRPVLVVHGYQDPMGKTAEQIHGAIRTSTLRYLKQCGHLPWLEQPNEFRQVLAEFFKTNSFQVSVNAPKSTSGPLK